MRRITLMILLSSMCLTPLTDLTIEDIKIACPNGNFEGQALYFSGIPEFYSSDGSVTINVGGHSKVVSYGGVTGRGIIIETHCWHDDIAVWVNAF